MQKISIIGGGAAGIMCAAILLEQGGDIHIDLFEKNTKLGVKVAISGGGRCNVTTGINDIPLLQTKYIRGGKFLLPALLAFPPQAVMDWFAGHGVPLKVENDMRVFPVSDVGEDIVQVFTRMFEDKRITVHFTEGITEITAGEQSNFRLISKHGEYAADVVILTTGGNAYRHTGSTGDGYAFAKAFGHTISPLGPSLNSFEVSDAWCKDLKGISFPNASLAVKLASGEQRSILGPALLTHFGVSGPAIFAMAAHIAFETISPAQPLQFHLTPDADISAAEWDQRILKAMNTHGTKLMLNLLSEFVPQRFAYKLLELAEIPASKVSAQVNKLERKRLVGLLSGDLTITLTARRPGDEFVTAGGIELAEVDRKTMRSRLNPNLYFAGEILDIDGLTGGFNLQAAWATGHSAAEAIVRAAV